MSDKRNRPKLYPFWLNGIQISSGNQDLINTEIIRRGGDPTQPNRLRNGIIRDVIDFTSEHYDLFLTWLAMRSNSA